ncbi:PilC/PilY family type IV pilus protein [Luteimonas sp. MJ250]|uniref:pilus assembly protein n=1 Tax=Luteimonas sp. MJ250 TaxID=3129236 RepID=UPI0031BA0F29
MALRRTSLASIAVVATLFGGGYFLYGLFAAQGQGVLAQAPLNTQVQVPPAFVMAIDDSGSMTYHNQFPGADGKGCWSRDTGTPAWSFFHTSGTNKGQLRASTDNGGVCGYAFSYGSSPRNGESNSWRGIPPVDTMGFARSSDFNPAYFDPTVTYLPWVNSDGTSFGSASLTATRIDPRPNGSGLGAVNLTELHDGREVADSSGQLSDRFSAYTGMVLPEGTEYRFPGTSNCGGLVGSSTWRTLSSDHSMTAQCNIFIKHRLAVFYLSSDEVPVGYESVPRVRAYNACGPDCDMWRYTIRQTDTEALQNFANWFSYYGNRHRSLVAGLTRSLLEINNMRIGYFRINQHGSYDNPGLGTGTGNERVSMRDMANATHKASLFNDILANPNWGSTYNRQAVYAAGRQFMRKDPLTSAANGAPVQLACQKNAMMLFTDGYSNSDGPAVGGVDNLMGVPFSDGHDNTLADIATSFYKNDAEGTSPLNTSFAEGQVPVPDACPSDDPRVNCQKNLHVNFYGITLGGRGNLFNPEVNQQPYTDPAIYQNWPSRQNDNRSTIDDIWHATVNTRGELVNARTPADILSAMRRILSSVSSGSTPSGSLAVTGARIGDGSLSVAPRYEVRNEGTDWFSELTAQTVSIEPTTRAATLTFAWEASDEMPLPGSRNVFFNLDGTMQKFSDSTVSLANLCTKPSGNYIGISRCTEAEITALGTTLTQSISYLLGDASLEKRNGGMLRDRSTKLGDIVNSTPVVSSPLDDYGYGSLPGLLGSSYATYLADKRNDGRYMVYVGANDGMLHAFDGGMGADGIMDSNGGREEFAYIPATAIGHMGNLLFPHDPSNDNDQKFDHRYYVDGPVTVSDANFGGWKTALVGSAGAGGRSVFALEVTDPSEFGTGANNGKLWEISDLDSSLPADVQSNIGHVLGKPVIVPIKTTASDTPRWVAIFGNGYNSASGKAVLFVVDIKSGTPSIRMIEAVEGSAPSGGNGLGNIVALDRWGGSSESGIKGQYRDGLVDTVYAADQRGALWKFDLRAPTPANVTVPLFTTRTHTEGSSTYRQPITGGLTAATGPAGGVLIYFGTGSFSFIHDPGEDESQSLYAVNDIERGPTTSTVTRSNLHGYSITTNDTTRTMIAGAIPVGARGWYVDLPAGERFVGYPRIATGMVFMPTYAPQAAATGCSTQGFNWLFGLNSRSGAPGLSSVRYGSPTGESPAAGTGAVALDTGGSAPVKDVGVFVVPRLGPPTAPAGGPGGTPPGTPPAPPEQGCWMMVTAAGAQQMYLPYPCGRQSWRQLQ